MFERIKWLCRHLLLYLEIRIHQRSFEHGLKYLLYKTHSDELLIVFSAFGSSNRRTYNYVRSLKGCKIDRLYILDPWGYKGSYNLYEKKDDFPWHVTNSLISRIMTQGGYSRVYTAGSSKGGTSAILFGLNNKVDAIFTGACQYNIGTYVARFPQILEGMMGKGAGEEDKLMLDSLVASALEKADKDNYHPQFHVVFSRLELTFERQIKDLLQKLHDCHFPTVLVEERFDNHNDVGQYFGPYLKKFFVDNYAQNRFYR